MPELLRRVALLTVVSAVAIGLLAPLTARSATPVSVNTDRLLSAAEQPRVAAGRAAAEGRERLAGISLSQVTAPIGPESLSGNAALAMPPSAPMEATLYRRSVRAVAPPVSASTISGKATWYCCTAGWRGQAVVALPGPLGGHYDASPAARFVTVCADRCALLPVVDYCNCFWGTASQKVADLSPEAWAAISDGALSRGVIAVTVHLTG